MGLEAAGRERAGSSRCGRQEEDEEELGWEGDDLGFFGDVELGVGGVSREEEDEEEERRGSGSSASHSYLSILFTDLSVLTISQPTRKSLQFQAVLLPNGLFAYVSGGWRPSVSPTSIFNFSGLPDRLLRYSHRAGTIPAESLCIYSDTDASPTPTHIGRFKVGIHEVGRKEELANNEMENLRGYVNLEMEEMGRNWGLLKDKKASKVSVSSQSSDVDASG